MACETPTPVDPVAQAKAALARAIADQKAIKATNVAVAVFSKQQLIQDAVAMLVFLVCAFLVYKGQDSYIKTLLGGAAGFLLGTRVATGGK
jgi:uncharacterized membrane protein